MRRLFVLGFAVVALAALAACGGAAEAGVASGKGAPSTGVAVTTTVPSSAPGNAVTPDEIQAVAENVFPEIQPFGYYGVCGVDGNLAACPYTDRLKTQLAASRETLMRSQNPSTTREVTAEATADGGVAHVRLFGGTEALDLVVVRDSNGALLVDDETCSGRPQTSVYGAFSACS